MVGRLEAEPAHMQIFREKFNEICALVFADRWKDKLMDNNWSLYNLVKLLVSPKSQSVLYPLRVNTFATAIVCQEPP